jgi:peptidyl-dipeptidase Dcp
VQDERSRSRRCGRKSAGPRAAGAPGIAFIAALALVAAAAVGPARAEAPAAAPDVEGLATAWPGPYGGLPPLDRATPAGIEAAYRWALDRKRAEVQAISASDAPPTFANTVAALDASGLALSRVEKLLQVFVSTKSSDEWRAVVSRVLPLASTLDDEIAFDGRLYARVDAVYRGLPRSAPDAEGRRLVTVVRDGLVRRGAALDDASKQRLKEINARLAVLMARFAGNLPREEESLVEWVSDAAELKGLSADRIEAAKAAARARNRPDAWAIPMQRPAVWPVLTKADSRALRERVFRQWDARGNLGGPYDNAPIMAEILTLRGEKARLLGYPTYAHLATAARMAGTPDVAAAMLERAWRLLLPKTRDELAQLQALAAADGVTGPLEPWDRLYYAEKWRQREFGLDADAVRPYLTLPNVMAAMLDAASRTYELEFREIHGVATVDPDVRVYEVRRAKRVVGVLYVDMYQRSGKNPASWASEIRTARRGRPEVLPIVAFHSAVVKPADGSVPLLEWERANVIFHEFGHALHMLSNGARYRALGSTAVPFDFIETPALLNERWLLDRAQLAKFARHVRTGEPMPDALIDRVERALKHDRVFSVNLDYLLTAIVDLRIHGLADGRTLDPVAEETRIMAELGAPRAVTPLLRVSHALHTFTELYGGAVYTYLWSDALAADIAEAFLAARGGLYDRDVARRYRHTILEAGNTRPMNEAFGEFRGRDPDPDALFRRFDLLPATP